MTVEEFNELELSSGDTVKIIMNDGTVIIATLYRGNAYLGRDEHTIYTTGEIVSAPPPAILINANPIIGGAETIILSEVENVILIEN
ncbi:MAG: hypothetical protein RL308_2630 [Bacteroidota bacterium]|jgi:hypothetical protein